MLKSIFGADIEFVKVYFFPLFLNHITIFFAHLDHWRLRFRRSVNLLLDLLLNLFILRNRLDVLSGFFESLFLCFVVGAYEGLKQVLTVEALVVLGFQEVIQVSLGVIHVEPLVKLFLHRVGVGNFLNKVFIMLLVLLNLLSVSELLGGLLYDVYASGVFHLCLKLLELLFDLLLLPLFFFLLLLFSLFYIDFEALTEII